MTSEVRKCPKTPFCHFWFSRNSVFWWFAEKLRRDGSNELHLKICARTRRSYPEKRLFRKVSASPSFLGKNPLFLNKFQKSISLPVDRVLIVKWKPLKPDRAFFWGNFLFFLILITRLATESKVQKTFSLKKKFVSKISKQGLYGWIQLQNLY